jgi:AAA domain (Cdc48 subfamily)
MTEMKYETDLFGPRAPFVDHEVGSPLNNFLCAMSGKRAIVLLDEFEKSSKEVWHSLLILFDEGLTSAPFFLMKSNWWTGKYVDRRNRRPVDCSKIIWIVATNALDSIISEFSKTNEEGGKDTDAAERSSQLQSMLISGSKAKFGVILPSYMFDCNNPNCI